MIVKIDRKDIDVYKEVCALSDYRFSFYSIESNPLMVQVEILEMDGRDLANTDALVLGRTIVWTITSKMVKA